MTRMITWQKIAVVLVFLVQIIVRTAVPKR